jgi:dipeptidyl aminopeptidase/acylaminoacyl peptidase
VVFERQAAVWALPFAMGDERPGGEPFLVLSDARQPTVAADGTLVMLSGGLQSDAGLAWIDRAGAIVRTIAEPRDLLLVPRVSPDGRSAVAARGRGNDTDLWIYDIERGSERRLTFESSADSLPTWSPDGQFIVYQCDRTVCARRADGTGPRVELLDDPAIGAALSPDGRLLAFAREVQPGDFEIFAVELGPGGLGQKPTAQPRLVVSAPQGQFAPEISPDGRYVAYTSSEGGRMATYVSQFPSGDGKWEVTLGRTHVHTRWSRTGERLFVMDDLARIVEFPVDRTRGFAIGAPLARIPSQSRYGGGYDLSADGTQFLVPVVATSAGAQRLLVVQHWRPPGR